MPRYNHRPSFIYDTTDYCHSYTCLLSISMGLRVVLTIFVFTALLNYCESQDDGIMISLGDRVIPNHGLVTTEDIGVDPIGTNLSVGLSCSTTYNGCCSDLPPSRVHALAAGGRYPSGNGSWLYAHTVTDSYVPRQTDRPNYISGITRSGRAVYVFRNSESDNNRLYVINGIWRCVIPDSSGREQTKYVGVYSNQLSSNALNGNLSVGTPSTIQFSIVSEDPVVFSLTFRTTGGPATHVTWTRDGVSISSLADNRYTPSQIVLPNDGRYTAGHYSNILTVSGRFSGVYGVSVTNDRTTVPVTPATSVAIIIDFGHSTNSLTVVRSEDLATISVSWTLVNSSFLEFFTSYEVKYTLCYLWSGNCETTAQSHTSRINEFTTTQYTVSDLTLWATYNFTVLARFNLPIVNESTHILPTPISTGYHTITIVGVLAPEIVSMIELAKLNITCTSVQVMITWNIPEGGLTVDEYVVSYRRLNGRDGQCSSFQDEGNVSVSPRGEGETILHLKAHYSIYAVNVTGRIGALRNTSRLHFKTNSTVPLEAPQNFAIINSTSTSVTISWDSVECIHRNGLIIHYIISYVPVHGDNNLVTNATVDSGGLDDGGRYTVTGLEPTQNYMFKVAAVNSDGVGVFATVSTNKCTIEVYSSSTAATAGMAAVIVVLVLIIVALSGAIIAIWVRRTRDKQLQSRFAEDSTTQKEANEGLYDEIHISDFSEPPKTSIEMDMCPAYEVTITQ